MTVTRLGGFTGNIKLSCTSVPEHAQWGLSSAGNVNITGGPQILTLTLNTSDVSNMARGWASEPPGRSSPVAYAARFAGFLLPALLLPRLPVRSKHRLLIP